MESVEGFLLVIEGAQTKNVFTIPLSVKQVQKETWSKWVNSLEWIKSNQKPLMLSLLMVIWPRSSSKVGMTKGKAQSGLMDSYQILLISCSTAICASECANRWGRTYLYQIGNAIFLIDDATFRAYQARGARWLKHGSAGRKLFRSCRGCDRCNHRWSSCSW